MPDPVTGVPFKEAIAYLKQKVDLPTRSWTDLWEGMHARAFVVAGAMRDELLADLHQAVTQALADGTTARDFRARFEAIVARHGWTGWTGEGTTKGRRWRARVIYDTNLRSARAAGRWQQVQRLKERRPYLRYTAVLDSATRPQHRDWHGTILPVDHPFWQTHYPPNGWYCRCQVVQLSDADLARRGLAVTKAPEVKMVAKEIKGRGKVETPEGIDPGFGHNAGIAAGVEPELTAMERHGPWEALQPGTSAPGADAGALDALPTRAVPLEGRLHDVADLRAALPEGTYRDPLGHRVVVGQAIVDHMLADPERRWDGREQYFPIIPELIEEPQEIWVGFARSIESGRVWLRRRYVRVARVKKGVVVGLVADLDDGNWSGMTFFRGAGASAIEALRRGGFLAWARPR